jgi:hypothetical protein
MMREYKTNRRVVKENMTPASPGFEVHLGLLILREYKNLAAMEADTEKSDALSLQVAGNDNVQMQGYEDRSKIREVLATKTARELMLK